MSYKKLKLKDLLAPVSKQIQPKDFGDKVYVGLEHLKSGDISFGKVGNASQVKSTKWEFQIGDILYGKLRPYLNKCAVADRKGVCSTDILVLRPSKNVDARYVAYCLSGNDFVEYSNSTVSGMNLPRTTWSKFNDYQLSVPVNAELEPDLTVQKRIADKLDKVFAEIEAGEVVADRNVLLSKKLFISYLHSEFDGAEIEKVELGSLCAISGGFGFPHSHQGGKTEKYPFYKVSDMNTVGNEVYMKTHNHSVSDEDVKKLKLKIYPAGTIIFPKIGAAIATNKKRILSIPSTVDNNVMVLVPNGGVNSEYLYNYLLNFDLRDWSNKSALPSIRKSEVEKSEVPMPMKNNAPDFHTQQMFAQKMKVVQDKTSTLSQLSEKNILAFGKFRQSVLFNAFMPTQ